MKRLVVFFDMAKKLKSAGWTTPTAYSWLDGIDGLKLRPEAELPHNRQYVYPAPTAEEIMQELPWIIKCKGEVLHLEIKKLSSAYRVGYEGFLCIEDKRKHLSEVAAQMWLWCVEKGHITIEKGRKV